MAAKISIDWRKNVQHNNEQNNHNKVITAFSVYECCSGATVLASPESQTEFTEV